MCKDYCYLYCTYFLQQNNEENIPTTFISQILCEIDYCIYQPALQVTIILSLTNEIISSIRKRVLIGPAVIRVAQCFYQNR